MAIVTIAIFLYALKTNFSEKLGNVLYVVKRAKYVLYFENACDIIILF
jgi:uncharacterized protein YlbG (UPF0298 family)